MEKAVLVIKMPKKCSECELFANESQVCLATRKMVDESIVGDIKIGWCPLRPLPEKQKLTVTGKNQIEKKRIIKSKSLEQIKKGFINNSEVAFYCGYNACLDEILGETE